MVELIVVMVVMGVMASMAIPRLTDRTALHERGFQDQFQSMLRYSRTVAVAQQRSVCVERLVGPPQQVRAVFGCGGAPVTAPGSGGNYVIDVPGTTAIGGAVSVQFDAFGRLLPYADRTFNVGARTLAVNRETGVAIFQN